MSATGKRPWWLRLLRGLVILGFVVGVLAAGSAGAAYYWIKENILSTLPTDLSSFRTYRPPTSCFIYDANGDPIDEFYLERRIWVPLEELAPTTWQAFIAAEDRRFMEHSGVDPVGILRAMWVNFRSGVHRQGGSTITQQLVKNLLVGKERSYIRKLREAALAIRLERELKKEEILELYINYVALGSGNYGVEAAALDYFGVSARELTPGQAALLAGLVPAPSRYSPRVSPEQAARRRELVLVSMVDRGYLAPDIATEAMAEPALIPRESRRQKSPAAAYATEVRRELRRLLGPDAGAADGLHVYTALMPDVQRVAEEAVKKALVDVETRQGKMGAIRNLPRDRWESFLQRAPGLSRPAPAPLLAPDPGDCFQVLVGEKRDLNELRAGPWTFQLHADDHQVRVRDPDGERVAAPLATMVRAGDVLRVCLDKGSVVHLEQRPWLEGAAVVLENTTGRVLALVGGYEVSIEGFVRATQARRQPGSSFKPYVYAAALLSGKTQVDPVLDAPLNLPAGGGKRWTPKNYDGKFHGVLPLRSALAQSLNTVAVRLTLDVGAGAVIDVARDLGVSSPLRKDPTIALGSSEVTPMDHALAYMAIARMGVKGEPVYIDTLRDARGIEVGRAGQRFRVSAQGESVGRLPGGPGERVFPAGVAYELVDMMREVVRVGTARSAYDAKYDRAGKTGTTNGFVDAWFVGFNPRYTIAVWIGTDGTATLGDKETGGKAALPAWRKIAEALPQVEGERFPIPDEAVLIPVGNDWLGFPRGKVPRHLLPLDDVDDDPLPPFSTQPNTFVEEALEELLTQTATRTSTTTTASLAPL